MCLAKQGNIMVLLRAADYLLIIRINFIKQKGAEA